MNIIILSVVALWFQITPPAGTYNASGSMQNVDAKSITFDIRSISEIVHRFRKSQEDPTFAGVLVDVDHASVKHGYDPEGVIAWMRDIHVCNSGEIWGKFVFTSRGLDALRSFDFRRTHPEISPVLSISAADHTPTSLLSVSFVAKSRLCLMANPRASKPK